MQSRTNKSAARQSGFFKNLFLYLLPNKVSSNIFFYAGQQTENQDCSKHTQPCLEWDAHLLWDHRGGHVPKDSEVNVSLRRGYFRPLYFQPFWDLKPLLSWLTHTKAFLSSVSVTVFCHQLKALSVVHYLCWAFYPPPLSPSSSSRLFCPPRSEKISPFSLCISFRPLPCFLFSKVAVTDWGQTKHRRVF